MNWAGREQEVNEKNHVEQRRNAIYLVLGDAAQEQKRIGENNKVSPVVSA